jgi:hypothetical protein
MTVKSTHIVLGLTANVSHIDVITEDGVISTKGVPEAALVRIVVKSHATASGGDPTPADFQAVATEQGPNTELVLYIDARALKNHVGMLRQAAASALG